MKTLKTLSKIFAIALIAVLFSTQKTSAQCTAIPGWYTFTFDATNPVAQFDNLVYEIPSGVTITLDGASFPCYPGTKIFVAQGGALLIKNGARLYASCAGNQWGGIEMSGDPSLPQLPTTNQPYVEIINSTIEDASIAVYSKDGSTIKVENSVFKNNTVGIKFESYPTYAPAFPIKDCDFEWNYTGVGLVHIEMDNVRDAIVQGCNFMNTSTNVIHVPNTNSTAYLQRGMGIKHNQSGLTVTASGQSDGCGILLSGRKSSFNGLGAGIYMDDVLSNTADEVDVSVCRFENNFLGIYSNGTRKYQVYENLFKLSGPNFYFTSGALFVVNASILIGNHNDNTIKNRIIGNTFYADFIGVFSTYGIVINYSDFDFEIRNNNFTFFSQGNNPKYAIRFDFHISPEPVAKISCNKFTQGSPLQFNNCNGIIQIGDVWDPANNEFGSGVGPISVFNNLPNTKIYYYKNLSSDAPPFLNTNIILRVSNKILACCAYCQIEERKAPGSDKGSNAFPGGGTFVPKPTDNTIKWTETPNPSSNSYLIRPAEGTIVGTGTLEVYDIAGKKIFTTEIKNNAGVSVNLEGHAEGVYMYRIIQPGQPDYTGKLLKQ